MNIQENLFKLEQEKIFFKTLILDRNLLDSNWLRTQKVLLLYNQVFENCLGQLRYQVLMPNECLAIDFQEFKNTFIPRSFSNLEGFSSSEVVFEARVYKLFDFIWTIAEKNKTSEPISEIDFFNKQTRSLYSLQSQLYYLKTELFDFSRSPDLDNLKIKNQLKKIKNEFKKVLEKYNFYLLKGVELWYVRQELSVFLFTLKNFSQAQFYLFSYLFNFDKSLFAYFINLNSTWVDICDVESDILHFQILKEIENNSNRHLAKLDKILRDLQ
jgi:hypothetical protein